MKKRILGRSGLEVSVVSFGCMSIGIADVDVLQLRPDAFDRLGDSCDGTGQRYSKDDISNRRSSFCPFVVIFDTR
jgi:aryl-alcohol dehydrogenase-like predicted oxidoreductase